MIAVTIWLASAICGALIGHQKGRGILGLLLGVLIGPIGVVIILCCPKTAEASQPGPEQRLLEQQLYLQRKQTEALMKLVANRTETKSPLPPGATTPVVIQIARNGEDLGRLHLDNVKAMLHDGRLSYEDYYLDQESNEWLPIECHPKLAR